MTNRNDETTPFFSITSWAGRNGLVGQLLVPMETVPSVPPSMSPPLPIPILDAALSPCFQGSSLPPLYTEADDIPSSSSPPPPLTYPCAAFYASGASVQQIDAACWSCLAEQIRQERALPNQQCIFAPCPSDAPETQICEPGPCEDLSTLPTMPTTTQLQTWQDCVRANAALCSDNLLAAIGHSTEFSH